MNVNMQSPKRTIIINTYNPKVICSLSPKTLPIFTENKDIKVDETSKKGRKRSLDHLTFEEKLLRK